MASEVVGTCPPLSPSTIQKALECYYYYFGPHCGHPTTITATDNGNKCFPCAEWMVWSLGTGNNDANYIIPEYCVGGPGEMKLGQLSC